MDAVEVVAVCPKMRYLLGLLDRVARTDATLVIYGESGTGKDLFARLAHEKSRRSGAALVKIDFSTFPSELLESELFGYEKGAFSGAFSSKPGRLEAATGGTLVLDELIHLSPQSQAKLLRIIEDREFMRLGAVTKTPLDVRLIVLSSIKLIEAVNAGLLRVDLFHRLNIVSLELPPLRERRPDLEVLLDLCLKRAARLHRKSVKTISDEAKRLLLEYEYPGNVRELQNILERAVILAASETIQVEHLPDYMVSIRRFVDGRKMTLAEVEALYIREVLLETRGHKTKAAKILGISRKNLYEKMKKYSIKVN
ncbi:MAG: sigma-54 dependent transcriptional regulator [Acidobacteriota bacterium]|nr:sigma-54 dependent transcriptional regulator [Blastocatellia bacterium]MDW8412574.1 sigma-54 dependent transcriptional regulator [Acidobacteriota bacterium]